MEIRLEYARAERKDVGDPCLACILSSTHRMVNGGYPSTDVTTILIESDSPSEAIPNTLDVSSLPSSGEALASDPLTSVGIHFHEVFLGLHVALPASHLGSLHGSKLLRPPVCRLHLLHRTQFIGCVARDADVIVTLKDELDVAQL